MPIEFHCPGCGKLMRTPDSTAGRKGKCPHCGTKVQIPISSLATVEPAAPARSSVPAGADVGGAAAGGGIRFSCGSCGRVLSVPSSSAGKQGRCPGCGGVTKIPEASVAPTPRPAAPAPAATSQFACPTCKKTVRVPASMAGQRGKCPHCGTVVMIPGTAGPRPVADASGLTPISSGGLNDLFADLPAAGPPASDPLGGFAGDPLLGGGAAAGGWAGGGFAPANPYASPASTSRPRSAGHTNKPKRSGLPWDRRQSEDSPFWSTVKLVLFSPTQAFYKMHRTGGLGGPLLYCVLGIVFGTVITIAYQSAFQILSVLIAMRRLEGGQAGAFIASMLIGIAIGAVGGTAMSAVGAVIGAFFNGGLIHLFLKLVGGAEHPFETTFRVVCYSLGTGAVCQIIPICGGLIGAVANLVLLITGVYAAHETTGGKAAAGVLLPILALCALCAMLGFMLFSMISGMIPEPVPPTGG